MNTQRRFEIYQATPNLVSRKHKTPGMTAVAPIPRPNAKKHPRPSPNRGFQRGAAAPLWSFQGGPGGKTGLPPQTSAAFAVGKGGAAE